MTDDRDDVTVSQALGALANASGRGVRSLWQRTAPLVSTGAEFAGERAVGVYRYLTTDTPVHKFNETLALRRDSEREYDEAVGRLEAAHSGAVAHLDELGRLELDLMDHEIRRFVRAFDRIKNIELVEVTAEGTPRREAVPTLELGEFDFDVVDAGRALITGSGTAAMVGAASWTAVTSLATASTGTAIGSLSGAAATNAALAWFGGGSIASGGLGMGAGAMVLGGIVAAPAILAGGWIDRKAAVLREQARQDAAQAALQVETIRLETTAAEAVAARAESLHDVLRRLRSTLVGEVAFVELLVARETDYQRYNDEERGRLMGATNLVSVTKDLIDAPLFDDDGALTDEPAATADRADRAMADLR